MAIAASCSKRAVQQIGITSSSAVTEIHRRLLLSNLSSSHASSSSSSSPLRHMSQLAKSPGKQRAFLVDTLAMVRGLESQGVPSKQAEAITSALTQVMSDSSENVAQSFISKLEMQKFEMLHESSLSSFKSQVQSSQENHYASLKTETEKLRNDIEKMRSELRYEIDKVTAGQRLDLNLERGMQKQLTLLTSLIGKFML
ncbi:hypothetical protein AQUCO_00600095v1 [Aquilegia coerulea]|uniref:Uncharacterized protein n=1 Tax=Aquilegia coerulea TaxID=218851 RepID=A0A2G5EMZ3_AQUCA|nr:hypothetical protein AQUCO_00600095v1 [Aquilegia coerulea]